MDGQFDFPGQAWTQGQFNTDIGNTLDLDPNSPVSAKFLDDQLIVWYQKKSSQGLTAAFTPPKGSSNGWPAGKTWATREVIASFPNL